MMNFLAIMQKKHEKQQALKERVLKNREAMLDIVSEHIDGAHACPFLLGQKCIGRACELFQEYKVVNDVTKKEFKYWRCTFVQSPVLQIEDIQAQIETLQAIRKLSSQLEEMLNKFKNT